MAHVNDLSYIKTPGCVVVKFPEPWDAARFLPAMGYYFLVAVTLALNFRWSAAACSPGGR